MQNHTPQKSEEELIRTAILRLDTRILGLVFGILFGVGLFLATNFLVLKGGPNVGLHLRLLGEYFPGYSVTFLGSLVGFVYAFVVGYVGGALIAAIYNLVVRPS